MTPSVGTAPSGIQGRPQTESSTGIDDVSLPIDWSPSKEFTRYPVLAVHGDSIKSVEGLPEVIKDDYVVYIQGYENSSNSPAIIPEAEADALEPVGIWLNRTAPFGVFNVKPGRSGPSLLVIKKPWAPRGTAPSPVGGNSVGRAEDAGLLASRPSDLGAGHVSYQRQTGDFFSLITRYSSGGVPDTDLGEHVLRRMHIRSALERAFRDGSGEVFEYGMESSFSRTLDSLIRSYSNDAVVEVERILAHADTSLDVKEECLLQLGAIEHNPTIQSRLSLLIGHLWSEQVGVRDCAALGIASMDDPSAIHPLQHAVKAEASDRLREDLQLVLDQLIATRNAQLLKSHS